MKTGAKVVVVPPEAAGECGAGWRDFLPFFPLEINHPPSIAPGRPDTTAALAAAALHEILDKKSTFQRDGGIVYSVALGHDISRLPASRLAISTSGAP